MFSCHCGLSKPQPGIYQHALQRMGVTVSEALFVGDGGSDEHIGAAAVGLDNVLLTRYINHYDEARLASRQAYTCWQIERLPELLSLLGVE